MSKIEYNLPKTHDPEIRERISNLISESNQLYNDLKLKDVVGKELILLKGVAVNED